jgi:hypothetical protein
MIWKSGYAAMVNRELRLAHREHRPIAVENVSRRCRAIVAKCPQMGRIRHGVDRPRTTTFQKRPEGDRWMTPAGQVFHPIRTVKNMR